MLHNNWFDIWRGRLVRRTYGIRVRYRMNRAFKKGRCRSLLAAL